MAVLILIDYTGGGEDKGSGLGNQMLILRMIVEILAKKNHSENKVLDQRDTDAENPQVILGETSELKTG